MLTFCTFLIRDRLHEDKESISVLTYNKNELIDSRQQRGVHADAVELLTKIVVAVGSDSVGLER